MPRFLKIRRKAIGQAPGTMVAAERSGAAPDAPTRIRAFEFDADRCLRDDETVEPGDLDRREDGAVVWLNVDGVHDADQIHRIGEIFGIHPLIQEDVLEIGGRPKAEEHADSVFIQLKMLSFDETKRELASEQVSIYVRPGLVISFQERAGDVFDNVRDRIRTGRGRVRRAGADYLAYALMDAVVDNYFLILETLGTHIETAEEEAMGRTRPGILEDLYHLRREMIFLRKAVWPLRDVIDALLRTDPERVFTETQNYIRDLHDHTVQIIDTVESYREMLAGLAEVHLSTLSHRMNEVMKVLTLIATIFIPLGFIAGVYGMNFEYMPELGFRYGYFVCLGLMATVAGGMLIYFRRRGWLGGGGIHHD
ncbi:MAG: magnesium/cobalt transporter CorA [Planctomycetota bacterium]